MLCQDLFFKVGSPFKTATHSDLFGTFSNIMDELKCFLIVKSSSGLQGTFSLAFFFVYRLGFNFSSSLLSSQLFELSEENIYFFYFVNCNVRYHYLLRRTVVALN